MTEVKQMTADKAHVVADVMSIMYGTLTILANIRECALKGRYYYQTANVDDETIKELRELGYVVTQGRGDVHWVMIEW